MEPRITPKEENKWNSAGEYLLYLRHLAAYDFAKEYLKGKTALEVGCGAGYGTNMLSEYASNIIGLDVNKETIDRSNKLYKRNNLSFKHSPGPKLSFEDSSFDSVISFQVIEHIPPSDVSAFLLEIKRVLKDKGIFICSTPNRKLRLWPFQKPWNPFHLKEYGPGEFRRILGEIFPTVGIKGLSGTQEIDYIEWKRTIQRPFNFYYIKYSLLHILLSFFKNREQNNNDKDWVDKFKLQDFKVDSSHVDKCFDLIGICIK